MNLTRRARRTHRHLLPLLHQELKLLVVLLPLLLLLLLVVVVLLLLLLVLVVLVVLLLLLLVQPSDPLIQKKTSWKVCT